jgi:hypothetical protein
MGRTYSYRDLIRDLIEGPFTSIGSYPKFFITSDSILSYDAVMSEWREYVLATLDHRGKVFQQGWPRIHIIIGCDVNWENSTLFCDDTGERIPSAYAD